MKALYKSIILNSVIYYVLIFIAGIFNVTSSSLIAILFLLASTLIISVNVMNFCQNYSEKKQLSFRECLLSGLLTGSISWGAVYLTVFLPSFIMTAISNNNLGFSFYIFTVSTLIICFTLGGSVMSLFSIIFSPMFTKKKPDKRYYIFASSILFLSAAQVIIYVYLTVLPISNSLFIEKMSY